MATKIKLRAAYDDFEELSKANGLDCRVLEDGTECPSKTQQQFAKDADVNTIVKRFGLTGELPTNERVPLSGDFTNVGTYQEALDKIRAADESFMAMPADVRERFANDPARFIKFCDNFQENAEEMIKLGLAVKRIEKPNEPMRVVIIDPTTGEVRKTADVVGPKTANA